MGLGQEQASQIQPYRRHTMLTSVAAQPYQPIGELLNAYRARHPDKLALVDVDNQRQLSYCLLAENVDAIALLLMRMGMTKGSRIALIGENSIPKIVIWLGIWRIGAVVCPLDLQFIGPAAPAIFAAINPALIIIGAGQDHTASLGYSETPHICFDENLPETGMISISPPDHPPWLTPQSHLGKADMPSGAAVTDLASLSCTSGTTGFPKIVAYDHAALWENGKDSIDLLELSSNDRTLEYRSLGWYSSQILSLMPFLQLGLTLHIARKFSYRHLPEWIETHAITVSVGVPAVIQILLKDIVANSHERFASLRVMTSSTAPLASEHWRRLEQAYGIRLLNLYGSSETGWICGNRIDACRIGTVGLAVPSVTLAITSESGSPCPRGVTGQMALNAKKLALGYWQQDGTLEAIRGKPFIMRDIATMDDDGYVYILGRSDDLINRGGVKVSPVEIEETVLSCPGISEAAAIGVPDPIYGQRAVCFIVTCGAGTPSPDDVLKHCQTHLSREKAPKKIITVESLPRNSRGKLLRNKLLELHASALKAK